MIRAIITLCALALAAPAIAAPQCIPRDRGLAILADQHGETRRGIGIADSGVVMEVFASEAGSWTITVTMPDGMMCLVASGQSYETMVEALPPQGTPG